MTPLPLSYGNVSILPYTRLNPDVGCAVAARIAHLVCSRRASRFFAEIYSLLDYLRETMCAIWHVLKYVLQLNRCQIWRSKGRKEIDFRLVERIVGCAYLNAYLPVATHAQVPVGGEVPFPIRE